MFDRFSKQSRSVMTMANQVAMRLNHEYVGSEHILIGLLNCGSGRAIAVLKSLELEPKDIGHEVAKWLCELPPSPKNTHIPQTPRAKNVISGAIEEAQNLKSNYVGTEHILLGLLRGQGGIATQVLNDLGLKLDRVRGEIQRLADIEAK